MTKRINKILWNGTEIPQAATRADGLDGLNLGELFIKNDPQEPSIYTRTTNGKVVKLGVNIDKLRDIFLNKDREDGTNYLQKFLGGIEVGEYTEGVLGSGAAMYMDEHGSSHIVGDYLDIRKKATFTTISVQELKHVGGEVILSPAAMVVSSVEELVDGWKCYFNTTDADGRKIYNEFEVGDQAICQTFNLENNTYYWRLVTEIGNDYIVLSKTDCDANSDIPKVGDNISQLGNRNDVTDVTRQAAIVLSAYGEDAPSYKQYKGIDSYSLVGKQVTKLSPNGNELTGVLNIEVGSTGAANLADFPDEVFKSVHIGAVNLLLNSGFTGNYESEELSSNTPLTPDDELYSKALKHWSGIATISDDAEAVSGRCVELGSLSQKVELIKGESYVISFKARGGNIAITCGDYSVNQPLSADYQRYQFKFVSNGSGNFLISGEAKVCDLQLERGTIATDWNPSPYDNDKAMTAFQALKYMQDAIKEGDTTILGGLILSSMIQLGNYKNGKMEKVNAGMSGIYSDDDDVAFWGGGTYEQAIRTITKFKQDSHYMPTEAEWDSLANFVVSHGGDAFYRGYIYALGGYFRGKIETSAGGKRIVIDPTLNTMRMYDGLEHLVMEISYGLAGMGNNMARAIFYTYDAAGNVATESMVTAGNVSIKNNVNNTAVYVKPEAVDFMDNKSGKGLTIGLGSDGINIGGNFWKNAQSALTGQMYVEDGFVKIK